jgi:hypothetical protein
MMINFFIISGEHQGCMAAIVVILVVLAVRRRRRGCFGMRQQQS